MQNLKQGNIYLNNLILKMEFKYVHWISIFKQNKLVLFNKFPSILLNAVSFFFFFYTIATHTMFSISEFIKNNAIYFSHLENFRYILLVLINIVLIQYF